MAFEGDEIVPRTFFQRYPRNERKLKKQENYNKIL